MNQTDQIVQNSVETFDKFKTCKGCPDRCAVPNCHTNCKGYLKRKEEYKVIGLERRKNEVTTYLIMHRLSVDTYGDPLLKWHSRKIR